MSIALMTLLAAVAWVGIDLALVCGWLAAVAVSRHCRRRARLAPASVTPLAGGVVAFRGHPRA